VTTHDVIYLLYMIPYILALPIWNLILPLYAFAHFDDFTWGATRAVQGEIKSESGHGGSSSDDHYEFGSVVQKKWVDWEIERRELTGGAQTKIATGMGYSTDQMQRLQSREMTKLEDTSVILVPPPSISHSQSISKSATGIHDSYRMNHGPVVSMKYSSPSRKDESLFHRQSKKKDVSFLSLENSSDNSVASTPPQNAPPPVAWHRTPSKTYPRAPPLATPLDISLPIVDESKYDLAYAFIDPYVGIEPQQHKPREIKKEQVIISRPRGARPMLRQVKSNASLAGRMMGKVRETKGKKLEEADIIELSLVEAQYEARDVQQVDPESSMMLAVMNVLDSPPVSEAVVIPIVKCREFPSPPEPAESKWRKLLGGMWRQTEPRQRVRETVLDESPAIYVSLDMAEVDKSLPLINPAFESISTIDLDQRYFEQDQCESPSQLSFVSAGESFEDGTSVEVDYDALVFDAILDAGGVRRTGLYGPRSPKFI
jgi:hypothetical protein